MFIAYTFYYQNNTNGKPVYFLTKRRADQFIKKNKIVKGQMDKLKEIQIMTKEVDIPNLFNIFNYDKSVMGGLKWLKHLNFIL